MGALGIMAVFVVLSTFSKGISG